MGSTRLGKPVCAPLRLSEIFPVPLLFRRTMTLGLGNLSLLFLFLSSRQSTVWCPWLCARTSTVTSSTTLQIFRDVLLLCHHPPALSSPPCSVIAPLLRHRPPALSSHPCSVITPLLSSSPCSVIIPLLCHRPPALSSSPCCHHPRALSSSPWSVIIPLLCHHPPVVIIPVLCHHPRALSSSPWSVVIPLLCYHPLALVITPLLCHHPLLSSLPCSSHHTPALSSPPAVITPLLCHHPPCSVIIPPLRSYPKRQPPPSSLVGCLIFPPVFLFPKHWRLTYGLFFWLERRSGKSYEHCCLLSDVLNDALLSAFRRPKRCIAVCFQTS